MLNSATSGYEQAGWGCLLHQPPKAADLRWPWDRGSRKLSISPQSQLLLRRASPLWIHLNREGTHVGFSAVRGTMRLSTTETHGWICFFKAGKSIGPVRTRPLPLQNRSLTHHRVSWLISQIQGALSWAPGALLLPSESQQPSVQPLYMAHGTPGSPRDNDQPSSPRPLEHSLVIYLSHTHTHPS